MTKFLTIENKEKVLALVQKNAFNYFLHPLNNELLQDKDIIFTTLKKDFILFEKIPESFFSSLNILETIEFLEIFSEQFNVKNNKIVSTYNNPIFLLCTKLLSAPEFSNFVNKKYPEENISSYQFHKENNNFIEEAIAFLNHKLMKENSLNKASTINKVIKF